MVYKVNMEFSVDGCFDEDSLIRKLESVFEFGTLRESIAEALELDEDPHLIQVSVKSPSDVC